MDLNAQLLYAVFWCVLGLVPFRARMRYYVVICVAGVVAVIGIAALMLYAWDLWIPTAMPLAAFLLCASLAGAGRAVLEQQERQAVMGLFAKHVSPDVAREIWARRDEILVGGGLRPVKLTATVLFSDIRGFTPISEKLGALELSRWLEEYMGPMSDAIISRHGLISKYIGDAIMALFGVPIARTSREEIALDALRAVQSAMAMREALAQLNRRWSAEGRPTAGTRIGIHTGDIIACSIGTAERREYTVLGDVVNTAARLESLAAKADEAPPECRILISAATWEFVRETVNAAPVGELTLKGKTEKVVVYQVL